MELNMGKFLLSLLLLSSFAFSQQIILNKDTLRIYDPDTLIISNTSDNDLILDTLFTNVPHYEYEVNINLEGNDYYYSTNKDRRGPSLNLVLKKDDTAKFIFNTPDLCTLCKLSSVDAFFKDTLILLSNSIEKDTVYIYVEGWGRMSDVNDENEMVNIYSLSQNYPNPFNPTTNISFSIPEAGNVKLIIFNTLGQELKTLINENKSSGNYNIDFNAADLPSGIYIYQLNVNGNYINKKMMLIK